MNTLEPWSSVKTWPLWQRILFRYWFSYLFFYLFPFPFSAIPGLNLIAVPWDMFVRTLVQLSAAYCFHVTPDWTHAASGSGDQLIRWVELGTYAGIALPIAIVWSVLDRKRRHYAYLFTLLRFWALLFVSSNMLSYGAAKIIPTQFGPLRDDVLGQNVGAKSPMGMLWTFMSASQPYVIFAGLAEFTAGILTIIPATRVLGTLVSVSVALEIFMLNMCYDVPVKILSGHLLLLSLFLLLPDAKNLFDIFCRKQGGRAFPALDLFRRKKFNRILWVSTWIFLAYYAAFAFIGAYNRYATDGVKRPIAGDYQGLWYVDTHTYNNQPAPADKRWTKIWFRPTWVSVLSDGDTWHNFNYTGGSKGSKLDLVGYYDNSYKMHLSTQMPDVYTLILRGEVMGTPTEIHLHRTNRADCLLLNRGFHWVNEVPYNR